YSRNAHKASHETPLHGTHALSYGKAATRQVAEETGENQSQNPHTQQRRMGHPADRSGPKQPET
ncbi:MAG: hypothetical protein WAQ77_01285, partial [Candidatus Acidiferrum sp.]